VLFDCAENARADLMDGVDYGENGEVLGADWISMDADAPLLKAACGAV